MKEKKYSRPGVNQFLALLRRMVIMQTPPAVVKRRSGEILFVNGADNSPAVVEIAPEIRVGDLVVERGLEGRDRAVDGVEDDLLTEVGDDGLFGDGELYRFVSLALLSQKRVSLFRFVCGL
jgi:hypothetical protein